MLEMIEALIDSRFANGGITSRSTKSKGHTKVTLEITLYSDKEAEAPTETSTAENSSDDAIKDANQSLLTAEAEDIPLVEPREDAPHEEEAEREIEGATAAPLTKDDILEAYGDDEEEEARDADA